MPSRCPRCGRFLSRSFVEDLAAGSQPCPRCGNVLTEREVSASTEEPFEATERALPEGALPERALPERALPERPADVPAAPASERDVLEGWDRPVSRTVTPARSFSPRYLPLLGAAAGGLVGALALPGRRPLGAAVGAIAGAGAMLAAVRSRTPPCS